MIENLATMVGLDVVQADEALVAELAALPLGQKRTSRSKAYVHVRKDMIFKGPYESNSLRLVNNLRYPFLIRRMEDSLHLPEGMRGVQGWKSLLVVSAGEARRYYLAAENVGDTERMKVTASSTAVDAAFQLVERETLLKRVSEIEKVKVGSRWRRHPEFDEQVAAASLQHLVLRYLLNVGDSGTHNILVREDRRTSGRPIAGIDFDDHRREQETGNIWDCLCKTASGYMADLYGGLVRRTAVPEKPEEVVGAEATALNALTGKWAECLPTARKAEGVVDLPRMTQRAEKLRSLMCG